MRLLLVELGRFRSRRAIVLLLVAAALVGGVLAGATIWETRPITASDLATAQARAEAEADQPYMQREYRRCERVPERVMGPDTTTAECLEMVTPRAEWFLYRETLSLAESRNETGLAVILIVAALMIIIGTTFAGADWSSGSMSNQLIFQPRRIKVWVTKAVAIFLATLLATAVIVAGFWVALYLTAEARGIPTGATVQESIRWMVARGALLAGLGAVGGYALTMLLRHTVGTLAAMFAYSVGGELLIAALPFEGVGRWSLANNAFAWLTDGHEYYDPSLPCVDPMRGCDQMAFLSLVHGATYLGVIVVVVTLLSVFFFRRRDIP